MRGLFLAAALISVALFCLTFTRKLERERRLLAKLRKWGASEPGWAFPLKDLSSDERDSAESLVAAGVLEIHQGSLSLKSVELRTFRQKRMRLMVIGGFGAFLLAVLVAMLILRR